MQLLNDSLKVIYSDVDISSMFQQQKMRVNPHEHFSRKSAGLHYTAFQLYGIRPEC